MVSPGKDVTLYIPTDTPPEVIDYMNRLKADGMFSQGVMDILTRHILQKLALETPVHGGTHIHDAGSFLDDAIYPMESLEDREDLDLSSVVEPEAISRNDFSLEQIFRQAGRNAGKLMHEHETEK